ncbi:MAG: hypothetical protein AAFP90_20625, partial [Planctomycetota bacterium]
GDQPRTNELAAADGNANDAGRNSPSDTSEQFAPANQSDDDPSSTDDQSPSAASNPENNADQSNVDLNGTEANGTTSNDADTPGDVANAGPGDSTSSEIPLRSAAGANASMPSDASTGSQTLDASNNPFADILKGSPGAGLMPNATPTNTPSQATANDTTDRGSSTEVITGRDTASESDDSKIQELPDGLRRYMAMLNPAANANLQTNDADIDGRPVFDAQVRGMDIPRGVLPVSDQAATVDAAIQMNLPLAIDVKSRSLADFCLLMTSLTGVPIRLNVVSLDAAGIDITAVQDFRGKFTENGKASAYGPAIECLRQAASQYFGAAGVDATLLHLSVNQHDVMLGANAAAVDLGTAPALQIDDLMEGAEDADSLQAIVQVLVGFSNDPDAPTVAVEGDALRLQNATWDIRWRAVLAVETLRQSRGLPARLAKWRTQRYCGRYDACQWPIVDRGSTAASGLLPMNYPQWTMRLASENQTALVVDWNQARLRGIGPRTRLLIDPDQTNFNIAVQSV